MSNLHVDRFGNHQIDSAADIFKEWLRADDAWRGGDEVEAAYAFGDEHALATIVLAGWPKMFVTESETYEFLCDHAAHGDTDDVHAPVFCPADVVQEFDEILRHFGGGVSKQRFATLAHASVIEGERCVFVGFGVSEVLELTLPCLHETAQSHNPLHNTITISKPP
jgi:hypothetical protein